VGIIIFFILFLLNGCRSMGSFPVHGVIPVSHSGFTGSIVTPLDPAGVANGALYAADRSAYKEEGRINLNLFGGAYMSRQGILREMGEQSPTVGISFSNFTSENSRHGIFGLWSFDHIWRPNSKLLEPKFWNNSYTNYLLAGGYTYRLPLGSHLRLQYEGGLAINFLEIDTFRYNNQATDEEFTDISMSFVNRVLLLINIGSGSDMADRSMNTLLGGGVFHYWSPDPVGKFFKHDLPNEMRPGGSLAWHVSLVFEW